MNIGFSPPKLLGGENFLFYSFPLVINVFPRKIIVCINVNQYVYSNIARLISYCQQEKYAGMKETGLTEAEWERKNPDWNKAILIPVTTSNSQSSSSSSSARLLLDMKLNSMRLVGENQPISINVIYSKFSK